MAKLGDQFTVKAETPVRDSRERVLANYLPEHRYRVTARNLEIVNKLVNDGLADIIGEASAAIANQLGGGPARVSGAVKS